MHDLRGVHFGSYWMSENDVVFLMAHDLGDLCDLRIIDTGIYDVGKSEWYEEDYHFSQKYPVRWLDHHKVLATVSEHKADFVIVNSGGMTLRSETTDTLKEKDVVCIGISLSDPDVFPHHGKVYSHLYDIYYTNSVFSLERQYSKDTNIKLLPFAVSPRLHRPFPDIEKKFDIVIVAHARPDRKKVVNFLKKYYSVRLFGDGWGSEIAPVHGEAHVRAINSGKMYLSFSQTMAGYTNIKIGLFEAAGCRTFLMCQFFSEMERFFSYGLEVVGYSKINKLLNIIDYYLEKDYLREWMAQNAYERCLSEHTWQKRWKEVLGAIAERRLG